MQGSVTDDGLPSPPDLTSSWSQVSGPAAVRFSAPQQAVTYVTFLAPGSYTLQVTATDSLGSVTLQVGPITVNPADASGNLATSADFTFTTAAYNLVRIRTLLAPT